MCGTSHIVRSDLYAVPAVEDIAWVKRALGSHRSIGNDLRDSGSPLQPLPFFGAIYRVSHAESISRSAFLRGHLSQEGVVRRSREVLGRVARLRLLTGGLRDEFFGGP